MLYRSLWFGADINTGTRLQEQAESACRLLANRHGRLVAEADDRQNLIRVVEKVLETQKQLLRRAERQLQECEGNLEQLDELDTALVDKLLYLPAEASATPVVSTETLASALPTKDNTQTEDMDLSDSDDDDASKSCRIFLAATGRSAGAHAAARANPQQPASTPNPQQPASTAHVEVRYEYSYACK